jgi:hypothetical protein
MLISYQKKVDENRNKYNCKDHDKTFATFQLENGIFAHYNSSLESWVKRCWIDVSELDLS